MPHNPSEASTRPLDLAQGSQSARVDSGVEGPKNRPKEETGQAGSPRVDTRVPLSPEIRETQMRGAKAIIAGRQRAEPLVTAPEVKAFLKREMEGCEPPVTPAAYQKVADWLNLQAHYPGQPVACFTTAEGVLTVLAAGEEEIEALLQDLSAEEAAQVVVEYPDPT